MILRRPAFVTALGVFLVIALYLGFTSYPDERLSPYQDSLRKAVWGDRTADVSFAGPHMHYEGATGRLILPPPSPLKGNVVAAEHPIQRLVAQGREIKDQIEFRKGQVQTLQDAVDDYVKHFAIDPPEGFDRWFEWATQHGTVRVPSLIPLAHDSVRPYLAMPASLLRSRSLALKEEQGVFGMAIYPKGNRGEVEGEELTADGMIGITNMDFMCSYMSPRWDYPDLLKDIIPLLPVAQQLFSPVQLSVCVRDGACRLSSGHVLEAARRKVSEGREFTEAELVALEARHADRRGWLNTCLDVTDHANLTVESPRKAFLTSDSWESSFDFCAEPQLTRENGEMIMESEHVMRPLAPLLAVSRPEHGADMLGVPTRGAYDVADNSDWGKKTKRQAVWRGTLTGIYHRDRWDWRSAQRHRLSRLAGNSTDEAVPVIVEQTAGVDGLEQDQVVLKEFSQRELVKRWLNVGVVKEDIENICGPGPTDDACRIDGGPQAADCPKYEASCDAMQAETAWVDRMGLEESETYRYILDVDGYGWSSRWRKLLTTGSVILKSTLYPEWWTAQAIPWYHFVPVQYSYSDLWDILSFFDGAPDGSTEGHEDIAREIARHGVEFAHGELRRAEMQNYMFLFMLEYRRAWSDDRQAASFRI